jgi:hypothetical protein
VALLRGDGLGAPLLPVRGVDVDRVVVQVDHVHDVQPPAEPVREIDGSAQGVVAGRVLAVADDQGGVAHGVLPGSGGSVSRIVGQVTTVNAAHQPIAAASSPAATLPTT